MEYLPKNSSSCNVLCSNWQKLVIGNVIQMFEKTDAFNPVCLITFNHAIGSKTTSSKGWKKWRSKTKKLSKIFISNLCLVSLHSFWQGIVILFREKRFLSISSFKGKRDDGMWFQKGFSVFDVIIWLALKLERKWSLKWFFIYKMNCYECKK